MKKAAPRILFGPTVGELHKKKRFCAQPLICHCAFVQKLYEMKEKPRQKHWTVSTQLSSLEAMIASLKLSLFEKFLLFKIRAKLLICTLFVQNIGSQ